MINMILSIALVGVLIISIIVWKEYREAKEKCEQAEKRYWDLRYEIDANSFKARSEKAGIIREREELRSYIKRILKNLESREITLKKEDEDFLKNYEIQVQTNKELETEIISLKMPTKNI